MTQVSVRTVPRLMGNDGMIKSVLYCLDGVVKGILHFKCYFSYQRLKDVRYFPLYIFTQLHDLLQLCKFFFMVYCFRIFEIFHLLLPIHLYAINKEFEFELLISRHTQIHIVWFML